VDITKKDSKDKIHSFVSSFPLKFLTYFEINKVSTTPIFLKKLKISRFVVKIFYKIQKHFFFGVEYNEQ